MCVCGVWCVWGWENISDIAINLCRDDETHVVDCAPRAMSSLDDILASMRAAAPSAPTPRAPQPSASEATTAIDESALADDSGRVPALDASRHVAGGEALDYRFRCGSLQLREGDAALLRKDCSLVFALNSSNWLAANAEPRCALERLARTIFLRHTDGVTFDPTRSGAEWWAQVRGGGDRHEGIEFHWDVDEHLCDRPDGGGVHVYPHLSTVTYLTQAGAPTLVLDAGFVKSSSRSSVAKAYGTVPGGAISYPRLGKTIVFDGAKLHGAVPCRASSGAPVGSQRVTFLVNIWLNHRPHAVEPLPSRLTKSMSQAWRAPDDDPSGAFTVNLAPPPVVQVDAATRSEASMLEVSFGRNDKVHALRVMLPPQHEQGASYRLRFDDGMAEVGPNKGGLKSDRDRAPSGGSAHPKKKNKRKHSESATGTE